MNFKLKSWDVFSWTAMRGGLFRLENDFTAIWVDNNGKEYRFAELIGGTGRVTIQTLSLTIRKGFIHQ